MVHQAVGYVTGRLHPLGPVRSAPAGHGPREVPGVVLENGNALVRNVDPAESAIERTTVAALREAYRLPAAKSDPPRGPGTSTTAPAGTERPDELWRPIAWGLLIVLAVETLVANRTYA